MTAAEHDLLHKCIDASENYLEFGCGESTIYAASVPSVKSIVSVESSARFVDDHLKPVPSIEKALSTGRLCFHVVDIGETVEWGFPKDQSRIHLWPNYSLSVFGERSNFDLCLIDGRFRVACALNCLLNLPDDCTIVIHDFWNRAEYRLLLEFLKVEAAVDTLGVFKKKADLDRGKIQSLIRTYQYLTRDKTLVDRIRERLIRIRYRNF
jgi:hypothetical protein